ncbi:TetR/AcrR family transcriptional regulator [Kaistia geumhonensis]|uniref:AcrR family transcriptional regulator n=1 Tax=Kaistia geumhonensis TaxID=410839 RepID=A0ABU0M456_9HYPH|nr:TetR/AcrR family transcriptional regulator [Kaistia geumhonensis]MCX5479064.1 TetR/AcrR family transcriptional regulator [Kaistia geumhonensis]MDQ0515716.1 AcrR family transcriptional regulator [Kaistia geumhonensis]
MTVAAVRSTTLRDACVTEALAIIADEGLEHLSLREVARRLGVSHGAPYRHFESRDHLLAAVVARCYDAFARHLDARPEGGDADADLWSMGVAYLDYALREPLSYQLMFSTRLPPPEDHPAMLASADHAFGLLRSALRRRAPSRSEAEIDADALFVWSSLHGLAGTLKSDIVGGLALAPETIGDAGAHMLRRIGEALGPAET